MEEKKRINRMLWSTHCFVGFVLTVAYLVEVFKGNRTVGYFGLFSGIILFSLIYPTTLYVKKVEFQKLGRAVAIGYFIMYLFALFTANTPINMVYILPLMVVLPILHNFKLCCAISFGASFANVFQVILYALTRYSSEWLVQAEIQVLSIFIISFCLCFMSKIDTNVQKEKLEEIQREKQKAEEQSETIRRVAQTLGNTATGISEKSSVAKELLTTNGENMEQVCNGTNSTAESVQTQMEVLGDLANGIEQISFATDTIARNMELTSASVEKGLSYVTKMASISEKSYQITQDMEQASDKLQENIESIQGIVEVITGIAKQINLLSLNASIEAARAGEAGRGFSVVASTIGELASQTASSLARIREEVGLIVDSSCLVTSKVTDLTEAFGMQQETEREVVESFSEIRDHTASLQEHIQGVSSSMGVMNEAKATIISSAENISAISEETTANASDTASQVQQLQELISGILTTVEELGIAAENLQQD